jgi:ribonuclease D
VSASVADLRGATIACTDEARALALRLGEAREVALDTEGDGMFRYRGRLCTLQLASAQELAVVDTLEVDPDVFADLLSARGPEKVVHDAAFDARMLATCGVILGNVFDTAVAARFLGYTSTGLASLLAELFDVRLPKHHQQADWGERPLDAEAVAYLENDVRYLIALRDVLRERVRTAGIEEELREECAHLLREAQKLPPDASPFARLKVAALRTPKQRARLYELALLRDELARELDHPPTRVLRSELLLRLAERDAPPIDDLARRLGTRHEYAVRLHEALVRAEQRDDAPPDELRERGEVPSMSEIGLRKRRRELLIAFRAREAAARQVDPQVILPGHCLSDLVKLPRLDEASLASVSGLGTCRIERYADRWRTELASGWAG